jgi:4-hydroxyacetophenone monooxygenase
VDAIILATGFRPDLFVAPMKLIGKEGKEIGELWEKENPQAYYGFCCNQFPNAFILLGPNSGLGIFFFFFFWCKHAYPIIT